MNPVIFPPTKLFLQDYSAVVLYLIEQKSTVVDLEVLEESSRSINLDTSLRGLLDPQSNMFLQLRLLTLLPRSIPSHYLVALPDAHVCFLFLKL